MTSPTSLEVLAASTPFVLASSVAAAAAEEMSTAVSGSLRPATMFSTSKLNRYTPQHNATLVFGDSFVGPFTLLENRAENAQTVHVFKFKGGTASGAGKPNSDTQVDVENRIASVRDARVLVFSFGQVDVHMTYYYKRFMMAGQELDVDRIVKNYVQFAATAGRKHGSFERVVLAVYPCPVEDSAVLGMLQLYRVLTQEVAATVDPNDKLFSRENRQRVLTKFNDALKRECEAQGVKFLSINEQITDEQGNVKPLFKDISRFNIHILWEPSLKLWSLTDMSKYGVNEANFGNLEDTWSKYKEYKEGELQQLEDYESADFEFDIGKLDML